MKLKTFFKHENKWCKNTFAMNKNSQRCNPESNQAVCFCLLGAAQILKTTPEDLEKLRIAATELGIARNSVGLETQMPDVVSLSFTNDSLNWTEFKEWLNKANV